MGSEKLLRMGIRKAPAEADVYEAAQAAGSAISLLEVVGPRLERQLDILIGGFINAPADLGHLLQFQAKISALWHLRRELTDMARRGKPAIDAFETLLKSKFDEVKEG